MEMNASWSSVLATTLVDERDEVWGRVALVEGEDVVAAAVVGLKQEDNALEARAEERVAAACSEGSVEGDHADEPLRREDDVAAVGDNEVDDCRDEPLVGENPASARARRRGCPRCRARRRPPTRRHSSRGTTR